MAMMEMMEPEPEAETLTLGYAEVVYTGVSLAEVGDAYAEQASREIAEKINDALHAVLDAGLGFSISGYDVALEGLTLDFSDVRAGSIIARFKMVGTVLVTSYTLIAGYPSFKEAVPMIAEDVGKAIQYILDRDPDPDRRALNPEHFTLYFRDEDELLLEISEKTES